MLEVSTPTRIEVRAGSQVSTLLIGEGVAARLTTLLDEAGIGKRRFVVSNSTVWKLHGSELQHVSSHEPILIPDGERYKTLLTIGRIYDALIRAEADRGSVVVAVGGGVVGDVAGFAAADAIRTPHKGVDHLRPMLDDVEAVELITPLEIRLRLRRPSSLVLRALAEIPILPMAIYDGSLLAGGALVGTGPWKFGSNKNGVVHLVRNDKYWGGVHPIADVEFVLERDAAVALTAAKRGELDIIPGLVPAHWPEQASAPGLAAAFNPLTLAPPRLRYFEFNAQRATAIADPRVRQALSLLIDRRGIAKRVFDGLARPANCRSGRVVPSTAPKRRCPTSIPLPPASCSMLPAGPTATKTASAIKVRASSSSSCSTASRRPRSTTHPARPRRRNATTSSMLRAAPVS
jgi:hypothetical protein